MDSLDFFGLQLVKIDPKRINFSQKNIKRESSDGRDIFETAKCLKCGATKAEDIPPIKVFKKGDEFISLDNRRLASFKIADVPVLCDVLPSNLAAKTFRKRGQRSYQDTIVRGCNQKVCKDGSIKAR